MAESEWPAVKMAINAQTLNPKLKSPHRCGNSSNPRRHALLRMACRGAKCACLGLEIGFRSWVCIDLDCSKFTFDTAADRKGLLLDSHFVARSFSFGGPSTSCSGMRLWPSGVG